MKTAFLFPGQGSQYVGMGKDLYEKFPSAKQVFDTADICLGFKISELCFSGNEETLKSTENAQPAILTVSIAVLSIIKDGIKADVVAGHSLGEYSSLVAAEALTFEDALRTVRKRGEFMKNTPPGTMAAILLLDRKKVEDICIEAQKTGWVAPANFNSPGQIVVSGEKSGVDEVLKLAKANGGKGIPLSVSGPFHSRLMKNAQDGMKDLINNLVLSSPKTGFIANVTSDYILEPQKIKEALISQIVSCVLWEDTIVRMIKDGVDTFVEVGPGKVLSGLVKKIKRDARVFNVENSETLGKFKTENKI
jgi:[acyl-carrier-protein] S-malonyltransferase